MAQAVADFRVVADYRPAGDQPAAIAGLVDGLEAGLSHQTLLGVTGSGKTFAVAKVVQAVQRPTLVLAPNKTLAAQLYGEFREFFPDNAVEYFVSYYDYYQPEAYVPASDTYIEKDASVNAHIEQMRLSATKALLERRDTVIVASVSAIYGLGDPQSYLQHGAPPRSGRPGRSALRRSSAWPNCSTRATTWRSSEVPTGCAATSSMSSRPSPRRKRYASNCSTTRSTTSRPSTR